MGITWADLDTTLQNLIDKKLDKPDDLNKNVVYANDVNGDTIGINYRSSIDDIKDRRIVQVDENGNILVPNIDDSSIDKAASNKRYVLSKVTVLDTTIKNSMPQITFENNVLKITTKTTK